MKKIISYILSHIFYWLGHVSSKTGLGYLYQKFMNISGDIQEWGGKGPWKKSDDLQEVIAAAMYEVRNEGVWADLPENKKDAWLSDAGYVVEDIRRKGFME